MNNMTTDCDKIAELAKEQERLRSVLESGLKLLEEFDEKLLDLSDALTYPTKPQTR